MTVAFEHVEPDEDCYAEYSANFPVYNSAHSSWRWTAFSKILRHDDKIVAGGRGIINMGALEVRGLWVDDQLRGTGMGSNLLHAIEQEAIKRGATRAMLYTYSWQAEAFYLKAGYKEFARFNYPDGPYRIDMQKELSAT